MGILRTVFALSVVFAHSSWNDGFVFVGGQNAVELFYVISGFLISYVIHTNEAYRNPIKFYVSRWLRIYPVYYAVAALSLFALLLGNRQILKLYTEFPGSADIMLVVSQLILLGQDWTCFLRVENGHLAFLSDLRHSELQIHNALLVPQAWTLGLEVSFYAMAPFILRNKPALYILLILSLMLKAVLIIDGIGRHDPWTYRFFPAELALFLLGALSHQWLLPRWKSILTTKDKEDIFARSGTYMLVTLCLSYFILPVDDGYKTLALFCLFIALLPLAFIYQNNTRMDKRIGDLSYPIYIGHMLVVWTVAFVAKNKGLQVRAL